MRAILRFKNLMLGGLLFVPAIAPAQSTSEPPSTSTPATDAVGPQELQNFSLSGSVTKPSDQQTAPSTTTAPATPQADAAPSATAAPPSRIESKARKTGESARASTAVRTIVEGQRSSAPVPQAIAPPSNSSPSNSDSTVAAPTIAPAPPTPTSFSSVSMPSGGALAGDHKLLLWPWLLAALAFAGAALFLFWRRRQQAALAGGPEFNLFVPPEAAPMPPLAAPAPPRAAPPVPPVPPVPPRTAPPAPPPPAPRRPVPQASGGIVSTRLRPNLELNVQPLRCVVENERVILEFELELFNSGTAPARAILAEASLFNAGERQEQELGGFFANPVGAGERLDSIPPMKRVTFINQVVAPLSAIQEYDLGGRKVFVPVLAFNTLYQWSGGDAQTSLAYLVGRETPGEKLGPLTLERGPRQIAKLAARLLPTAVRT